MPIGKKQDPGNPKKILTQLRNAGIDLFFGVLFIIFIHLIGMVLYILGWIFPEVLHHFPFSNLLDPIEACATLISLGILVWTSLNWESIKISKAWARTSSATRKLAKMQLAARNDSLSAVDDSQKASSKARPGLGFIFMMLFNSMLLVFAANWLFDTNLSKQIRTALFVSFWISAFLYLPTQGAFEILKSYLAKPPWERSLFQDLIKTYFRSYGRHLIFPMSFCFHSAALSLFSLFVLSNFGFEGSASDWGKIKSIAFPALIGTFFISFFLSAFLSGLYEKLIFKSVSKPFDYTGKPEEPLP